MSPAANRQGILAMLLAMSAFIGSDTLMKIATGALSPGQIMAVRGLFASLITLGLVAAAGEFWRAKELWSPLVMIRAALEGLTPSSSSPRSANCLSPTSRQSSRPPR